MKPLETTFKRIETKYIISKDKLDKLIQDLKEYFSRRRLSNFNYFKYLL